MSLPGQRSVQRSRTDPGSLRIGTCGAIRLPGAHLSADSLLPGSQNWQLLAYLRAILGLAGLEVHRRLDLAACFGPRSLAARS